MVAIVVVMDSLGVRMGKMRAMGVVGGMLLMAAWWSAVEIEREDAAVMGRSRLGVGLGGWGRFWGELLAEGAGARGWEGEGRGRGP